MKTRNLRKRRKGLTLMEVMLVLVILGILGSMAAMFITSAQRDAMRRATKAEIDVLVNAVERYHLSMFSYPQQEGLQALLEQPSNDSNNRWAGPYIQPNDDLKDPWGNDYEYEPGTAQNNQNLATFTIRSAGPDGSMGSEDDVSSDDQF